MSDVIEDVRDNFADRLLAAMGMALLVLPTAMLGLLFLIGGMVAGVVVGALTEEPVLMSLGMLAGLVVGAIAGGMLLGLVVAPLQASLGRAMLRNLQDGSDLGLGACFDTVAVDVGKVVSLGLIMNLILTVGGLMFYVPALVASWALNFAMPGVVVHRLGPLAAMNRSLEHAMAEPVWHLALTALSFGALLLLLNIPFIGYALGFYFVTAVNIRAYVACFGQP
jgi:hypothetical protein